MKFKKHNMLGFTLIELMIVIVIIAILASIAYPSYQDSIRQARRADAQANLLELANFMERFYTENNSYSGVILPFTSSPQDGGGNVYYNLSVAITSSGANYTLSGSPQGTQTGDSCPSLSLTHTGVKGASGCW